MSTSNKINRWEHPQIIYRGLASIQKKPRTVRMKNYIITLQMKKPLNHRNQKILEVITHHKRYMIDSSYMEKKELRLGIPDL